MPERHGSFAVWNRTGNRAVALLLRSPLHSVVSGQLALITVTGQRSGREYTFPVGYQRAGERVTISVGWPARKLWWRNLRGGALFGCGWAARSAAALPPSAATSVQE